MEGLQTIYCGEQGMEKILEKPISLKEFDQHLDNYKNAMQLKEITLGIFWKQFKILYNGQKSNFVKTYQNFKMRSRHLHNKQLNLF